MWKSRPNRSLPSTVANRTLVWCLKGARDIPFLCAHLEFFHHLLECWSSFKNVVRPLCFQKRQCLTTITLTTSEPFNAASSRSSQWYLQVFASPIQVASSDPKRSTNLLVATDNGLATAEACPSRKRRAAAARAA